ncbi:MAG: hypothetical protein V2B19_10895 [Pseudomonadota bacterium]
MENLLKKFERYLKDVLDVSVSAVPWEQADRLPFYLRDLYLFFKSSILDIHCLLMVVREPKEQTPAVVRKHLDQVGKHWNSGVIYIHPLVSTYNRKRLIQHKVPFVVPGNQMYLPMLGIDFREHFRRNRSSGTTLSPATHTLILHALLNAGEEVFTPSNAATRLGYSAMTLTRAFDELESTGLAEISLQGRERMLHFKWYGRELWENAKAFMRSPVKKRILLRHPQGNWPGIAAGLAALSHLSMLAPPANPVYAVCAADFNPLKKRYDLLGYSDDAEKLELCEIEVWCYHPSLFAANNLVDRFSLYLSLSKSADERVQSALEIMMESIKW